MYFMSTDVVCLRAMFFWYSYLSVISLKIFEKRLKLEFQTNIVSRGAYNEKNRLRNKFSVQSTDECSLCASVSGRFTEIRFLKNGCT